MTTKQQPRKDKPVVASPFIEQPPKREPMRVPLAVLTKAKPAPSPETP